MKIIMKLIFSYCLIQSVYGSDVVIISYQTETPLIDSLEKILVQNYFIPQSLIKKIKTEFECEIAETSVLHLCLTNDSEMKFVDLDIKKVREVLGVFYEK